MVELKKRDTAADVIRCTALLLVVSVHFFLNTEYYQQPMVGKRMFVLTLLRSAFMPCVPLFLMLSGYLMHEKRPDWAYFRKIGRTLAIYLLASLLCGGFRLWNMKSVTGGDWLQLLEELFLYKTAPYGWYVEMYIGLFFMLPYLNLAYHGLQTQRQKQVLIGLLVLTTALPEVVNIHCPWQPGWWGDPVSSEKYIQFLPDWWSECYPVTYYFLGCYLREYPIRWKGRTFAGVFFLACLTMGGFCYYRSFETVFLWGRWQDNGSLFLLVESVVLFGWLATRDYSPIGMGGRRVLAWVSRRSLGAYLVSYIFDTLIYPWLNQSVAVVTERIFWFPVAVPTVLVCSLLLSGVMELVVGLPDRKALKEKKS